MIGDMTAAQDVGVEPGRYIACLIIESPNWYPGCLPRRQVFTELRHHIRVTHDGEVLENHYDAGEGDQHPVTFDPPRRWDPKLLKKYQLQTDMS